MVFTHFCLVFFALSHITAWAIPTPPQTNPDKMRESLLEVRLDVTSLVGPAVKEPLVKAEVVSRLAGINKIWSQCGVKFSPRLIQRIEAQALGVTDTPQSQDDLSVIAGKLNPNGFESAIPLTIAGHWKFYDQGSGLNLHGLGWVFVRGDGTLDRIGAMVGVEQARLPHADRLMSHELGHALSLGHSPHEDNVMAGGDRLTLGQCEQVRGFLNGPLNRFLAVR